MSFQMDPSIWSNVPPELIDVFLLNRAERSMNEKLNNINLNIEKLKRYLKVTKGRIYDWKSIFLLSCLLDTDNDFTFNHIKIFSEDRINTEECQKYFRYPVTNQGEFRKASTTITPLQSIPKLAIKYVLLDGVESQISTSLGQPTKPPSFLFKMAIDISVDAGYPIYKQIKHNIHKQLNPEYQYSSYFGKYDEPRESSKFKVTLVKVSNFKELEKNFTFNTQLIYFDHLGFHFPGDMKIRHFVSHPRSKIISVQDHNVVSYNPLYVYFHNYPIKGLENYLNSEFEISELRDCSRKRLMTFVSHLHCCTIDCVEKEDKDIFFIFISEILTNGIEKDVLEKALIPIDKDQRLLNLLTQYFDPDAAWNLPKLPEITSLSSTDFHISRELDMTENHEEHQQDDMSSFITHQTHPFIPRRSSDYNFEQSKKREERIEHINQSIASLAKNNTISKHSRIKLVLETAHLERIGIRVINKKRFIF